MHGQMHCQITILLVVDTLSSSAYPMMTHPFPVPSNLPIKTLVARQLPTNGYTKQLEVQHVYAGSSTECTYVNCETSDNE